MKKVYISLLGVLGISISAVVGVAFAEVLGTDTYSTSTIGKWIRSTQGCNSDEISLGWSGTSVHNPQMKCQSQISTRELILSGINVDVRGTNCPSGSGFLIGYEKVGGVMKPICIVQ